MWSQYAFYLHAIDTRRAVKCGIAAVTWCDVAANHRCAAHSILHFTFRIPHDAVPHFTHSPLEKRYLKSRRRYCQLSPSQSTSPHMIEADGPLPLAGVNDLMARGYCSFQVTKCDKKLGLTSVS